MQSVLYPDLEGKIVLVTGGAGDIGSAICRLFAANKAKVIVADMDEEAAQKLIPQLPYSDCAERHIAAALDVGSSSSVNQLAEVILSHYNDHPPQILVHCVGIRLPGSGLLSCTEEKFDKVMTVNAKGTFLVNQKFVGLMVEKGLTGCVINLSSVGHGGSPKHPEYSASKAATVSISLAVAKEMAGRGIRVIAVVPGGIGKCMGVPEHEMQFLRRKCPMGQPGTTEDVAQLCAFLASEQANYITCCVYNIHGGLIV